MKKVLTWKNLLILALVLWGLLLYFPALKLNFSLIDDGLMILNAKKFWELLFNLDFGGIRSLVFEPEFGRVRPAYWIIQSILSLVGGFSAVVIHLLRVLILTATLWIINIFLKKFGTRFIWRVFVLFVFLTDSLIFENYYRLGPTETFLGLFFILTSYIVFFGNNTRSDLIFIFLFSFFGVFTKENYFLVFIPFLLVLLVNNSKSLIFPASIFKSKYASTILFCLGLIIFYIKSLYPPVGGAYSTQYEINFTQIISNAISYKNQLFFYHSPLLHLSLAYFIYLMFKFYKNKIITKDLFFLAFLWLGVFTQLGVLFPWKFALGRYLVLVNTQLALIYAISLPHVGYFIYHILNKNLELIKFSEHKFVLLYILLLTPLFLIRNMFPIANFQLWQKMDSDLTGEILTSLSSKLPENSIVYTNYKKGDANVEIFLELPWHLELFSNRSDIDFSYLDNSNLCSNVDRFIFDRRSDRFLKSEAFSETKVFEILDSGKWYYRPLNYGVVRDSFLHAQKLVDWNGEHEFDWHLYKQKKNSCIDKKYIVI